ncbi:MAG: hypothetical protein JSW09_07000 [Pseudomonadota bacterium]|nr:MAG: hypothetical protein JSW09_07000 [Pseudomonadota bacterium]
MHWEELDAGGTRLLEETGPRLRATLAWDNFSRPKSGLLNRFEANFYFGRADYDGQTITGIPATTDNYYVGYGGEAMGGWRFGDTKGIDLLGALGVDVWRRDIRNGTTNSGLPTQGYIEDYLIAFGRLGLGAYYMSEDWQAHLALGAKRPLWTYERVYLSDAGYDRDITLRPGKETSGFVRLQVDFGPGEASRRVFAALFYDSWRFGASNTETASSGAGTVSFMQPESHMDVIGLEVGMRF